MIVQSGSRRGFWIGLTVTIFAFALLAGFLGWTLHPANLKPRLIAAVQRATGRTLTISGKVGIRLALVPTVTLDDVTLSNPPGFSRPEMAKVARVELGLDLLPLLGRRFEVDHVTLVRPDILLETDPAGGANWMFGPAAPTPGSPAAASAASGPGAPATAASSAAAPVTAMAPAAAERLVGVWFRHTSVVDGRIGWIDGGSGRHILAEAVRLNLTAQDRRARATGWCGHGRGPDHRTVRAR